VGRDVYSKVETVAQHTQGLLLRRNDEGTQVQILTHFFYWSESTNTDAFGNCRQTPTPRGAYRVAMMKLSDNVGNHREQFFTLQVRSLLALLVPEDKY